MTINPRKRTRWIHHVILIGVSISISTSLGTCGNTLSLWFREWACLGLSISCFIPILVCTPQLMYWYTSIQWPYNYFQVFHLCWCNCSKFASNIKCILNTFYTNLKCSGECWLPNWECYHGNGCMPRSLLCVLPSLLSLNCLPHCN